MTISANESKAKLLIVEDEILVGRNLKSWVEGMGHLGLGPVPTGEQALALVEAEKPDLVLMDIELQGPIDGIQAAGIIQDRDAIPVVFVTAHVDEARLARAKTTLPLAYLLKPIDPWQLKATVDMALHVARIEAQRRKAEEELRESQSIYKLLSDHAPTGIYEVDFNTGRFVRVNRVMCEKSGYDEAEFLSMNFLDILTEDSQNRALDQLAKLRAGLPLNANPEYCFKDKSGKERWVRLNVDYRRMDGQIVGAVVVVHEITERVLAEAAIRESEERFRAIFENASVGMAELTPQGIFTKVNRWLCDLIGYSPSELYNLSFREITHPDDLAVDLDQIPKLLAGDIGNHAREKRYVRKDGRIIWANITVSLVRDPAGAPLKFIVVIQDITERKETERALRESEERFRLTFDTSPDAVNINRLVDGLYVDINQGFTALTGFTREDVIGLSSLEINIWHDPADRQRLVQALKDQGYMNNLEARFRRKDGSLATALMSARVILLQGIPHIISITRDISEHKKLEEQLRHASKLEAVGTLAGGVAHDFNNIIQVILGYADLLLLDKKPGDDGYDELTAIGKASKRGAQLVRHLLTFGRKMEAKRRPLDLNRIILETERVLERTIPRMINLELKLGRQLATIEADPTQIEQILLNLGSNAADAMPDGGRLLIETANTYLDNEYAQRHLEVNPGRYVRLTVSDTGHGMDGDTAQRIFDPFFTTKEVGKGTGLGLASVYGIVQGHGGHIGCYTEPGLGTTFNIYFPALDPMPGASTQPSAHVMPTGGPEMILLVDDEPFLRNLGQGILERFGYQVILAQNGEEALAAYQARTSEIALVILDLSMPGMGGHKCLAEILKLNPEAKIMISSGYSANGQARKTLESGAAGFIGKPYELTDMLKAVRDVLDRKPTGSGGG